MTNKNNLTTKNDMSDEIQVASPGTKRELTGKEVLILCTLTRFKVKDNLAIRNNMEGETQVEHQEILCAANPILAD